MFEQINFVILSKDMMPNIGPPNVFDFRQKMLHKIKINLKQKTIVEITPFKTECCKNCMN